MLSSLNEFLTKWEGLWLFLVLVGELAVGSLTLYWVKREYDYDYNKDVEKKQRRTKTTKKTTKGVSGEQITEETTEIVESVGSENTPKTPL